MGHKNYDNWFVYELQGAKLSNAFESLSDSVAATLGTMKPDTSYRAVMELEKQLKVVEKSPDPEKSLCSLTKRKDTAFAAGPCRVRDSGCIKSSATHARTFLSITIWHVNKLLSLLTKPERAMLIATTEKEEDVL